MIAYLYLIATDIKPGGLPEAATNSDQIRTIIGIVFGIVGALALVMLVISGLRYIVSGGDPGNISKAKEGIIYSLVGLLIALTAEAIVFFVVGEIGKP